MAIEKCNVTKPEVKRKLIDSHPKYVTIYVTVKYQKLGKYEKVGTILTEKRMNKKIKHYCFEHQLIHCKTNSFYIFH